MGTSLSSQTKGGTSGTKSQADSFIDSARQKEAAGDIAGAMEDLLAAYRVDPSRSDGVRLAHELSQRFPSAHEGMGCPVQMVNAREPREKGCAPAKSECSLVTSTCNSGDLPNPVTDKSATPESSGTPWERGWQGPKDFKPPAPTTSRERADHEENLVTRVSGKRNFTLAQLQFFDGSEMPQKGSSPPEPRPIYIALKGIVYDASAGRELYGPRGKYSALAGCEASRCVARGVIGPGKNILEELNELSLEGLHRFEQMTLDGWVDTFAARGYPVMGKVVPTPKPRPMSREKLRQFDGRQPYLPSGYSSPPIYVGVGREVFDVSFGGSEFYTKGGPYECLAGRDASRVLARMSMTQQDIEGVLDYDNLSSKEKKNLQDWSAKLGKGKGYPVVGWLD